MHVRLPPIVQPRAWHSSQIKFLDSTTNLQKTQITDVCEVCCESESSKIQAVGKSASPKIQSLQRINCKKRKGMMQNQQITRHLKDILLSFTGQGEYVSRLCTWKGKTGDWIFGREGGDHGSPGFHSILRGGYKSGLSLNSSLAESKVGALPWGGAVTGRQREGDFWMLDIQIFSADHALSYTHAYTFFRVSYTSAKVFNVF